MAPPRPSRKTGRNRSEYGAYRGRSAAERLGRFLMAAARPSRGWVAVDHELTGDVFGRLTPT